MHTLREQDRDNSMTALVSFHEVPMPRGVAFCIDHIEHHGGRVAIFSADRTVGAINEHNKQFGTHLSAQQHLIDLANRGEGNRANPVDETSHCYHADATIAALLTHFGHRTSVRGKIPWWAVGIDLADVINGKVQAEEVEHFLLVSHNLGYDFRQPYPSASSEKHHVILVNSPIPRLESWKVISENRSAT